MMLMTEDEGPSGRNVKTALCLPFLVVTWCRRTPGHARFPLTYLLYLYLHIF